VSWALFLLRQGASGRDGVGVVGAKDALADGEGALEEGAAGGRVAVQEAARMDIPGAFPGVAHHDARAVTNDASERALGSAVRELGLTEVALAGSGLEFSVWHATHPRWGPVALRVPARAIESNANDPHVVTAELQRHEAEMYRSLRPLGLPVPRVFDVLHYDVDVLVVEYVPADGSAFRSAELGEIVARLHALPVPASAATGFAATIAERMDRRWSVLRQRAPGLPASPGAERLAAAIPAAPEPSRLHMDVRASNTLTRGGRVEGLIDWSNSWSATPRWSWPGSPSTLGSPRTRSIWTSSGAATPQCGRCPTAVRSAGASTTWTRRSCSRSSSPVSRPTASGAPACCAVSAS
jgi:Phosphotransferase enzyme family